MLNLVSLDQNEMTKARDIAAQFGFILSDRLPESSEWYLMLDKTGLALHAPHKTKFKPLTLDFSRASNRCQRFSHHEPLAKAMASGRKESLWIIDATAGLGRDAFLLASLGHRVTLVERHPILAALLFVALEQAKEANHAVKNMTLIYADSAEYLQMLSEQPNVIYLDPMFPERNKSALVKKEMQVLHTILDEKPNTEQLLDIAISKAKDRVVIKRPRHGEYLNEQKPHFQILSKTHRFDIIIPHLVTQLRTKNSS